MKRRILSLLLCSVIIISAVPLSGFAADLSEEDAVITQSAAGGLEEPETAEEVSEPDSAGAEDAAANEEPVDNETEEESKVNLEALKEIYNSIPPKSQWDTLFVDYENLEGFYDIATEILSDPSKYPLQSFVDSVQRTLRAEYEKIGYHTLGISLDKSSLTLDVGSSQTLKATLDPENAADSIKWSSSDSSIVQVSNGVVTALKHSSNPVTITAASNGYSAECVVRTLNPLGGVSLSETAKTIYDTEAFYLNATAYGKDASSKMTDSNITYTWKSSNTRIAMVADNGYVSGVQEGTATITVTASNGKSSYEAKCVVTVNEMIQITGLQVQTTVIDGCLSMAIGETATFKVKITPENASMQELSWKSSAEYVASITDSGVSDSVAYATFEAKRAGESTVTYTAQDGSGAKGSFKITVLPLVSTLALSETVKVVSAGSVGNKLIATVLPKNAGNQVLEWSSSDSSICGVDKNGVLIPKNNGICTITAKTTDASNISVSCSIRVAPIAQSIALNHTSLNLKVGSSSTLTATVRTAEGTIYTDFVEWISENTKVASVDSNGKITALYPGEAKIKAVTLDGTELTSACVVSVTQPVTGVSLPASKTVGVNSSTTLTATLEPSYASNKNVTWSTSDSSIATVDSNGKVTAKSKVGSCKITVTTADGGYKASCTVNVAILTTGITLSRSSATIKAGNTLALTATVSPTTATDKTVKWSSSNTAAATVSSSGVVTGVAGGTATITATASGGQKATCVVSVTQSADAVTLNTSSVTLYVTQQYTLKASLIPSTATDSNFAWSSSNKAVAVVSNSGVITAVGKGSATITVTVGSVRTTCAVTVVDKINVTGVSVNGGISIAKGESYALSATVSPSNASVKTVSWSSSNTSIATVSSSGVVTAVGTGRAVITAKTNDGGYTASCNVTVTQAVTGVRLNVSNTTVAVGGTTTLISNVFPTDATVKTVKWNSSDTNILTVKGGVITGVKSGSAIVTVTTDDGGFTASCTVNVYIAVTGVKLSSTALSIPKGETRALSATVLPTNATDRTVTWSSSNTNVADVSATGQITAKNPGSAAITVTTKSGYYKATCNITVVQLATKVTLDYAAVTLSAGKTKTLTATLKPTNATNKTVKWTSSNTNVAKVNSKGKVTAVGAGTATIKATSGDNAVYSSCKITVLQQVTSIKLSSSSAYLHIGKSMVITAAIKPANATNKKITWTSSDDSVATVDSDGVVKGLKKGTVTITASAENGKITANCKVTVSKAVTGISLNKSAVTVAVGKTTSLTPTIKPSNAANKNVTWSSNNRDVATVNSKGVITAKSNGYAEITAKTKDGGYKAVCRVTVVTPVKSIKLNAKNKTLDVGENVTLKVTFSPKNASNTSLKWSSSNKKVVKVNSKGKITGLKTGTAVITVKSVDGGYKATCNVTVIRKVRDVTLNKSAYTLYLDKSYKLKADVVPSNATDKSLTWTSSNEKVVRVSSNGKLTPVKPGSATITVKSKQSGITAKCKVTVERAVKSIKLSKSKISLVSGNTYTLKATLSPSNASNKKVKWASSNTAVAKVSSSGVVTAVGRGKATITATTSNGLAKKCTVSVTQPVRGVSLSSGAKSVYTGQTFTLTAAVIPAAANNKTVTWSSSNTSVATVSQTGVVSAVKAGTANITVKTNDGNYTASCKVTVLQRTTSVKLSKTSLVLSKGNTATVSATVLPSDATNKSITWSSSNKNVATVTEAGQIKALSVGETVITVTAADGGCKATCVVTVSEPVTGVTLNLSSATVYTGEKITLKAYVSPSDASNKLVGFTSSNSLIASVNSEGTVTAESAGNCVITATTVDGKYAASCTVTVLQGVQKIVLSENEMSLKKGSTMMLVATVLPADAFNKNVTWTSSNESVVTVDKRGIVTAVKAGTATITVKTADGGFTDVCVVTVTD